MYGGCFTREQAASSKKVQEGFAKKIVHAGIRAGSGSDRVVSELRALWLIMKCWFNSSPTPTQSLPLPVLMTGILLFQLV
jgi:hypothetical protein